MTNFDNRSFRLNFEITLVFANADFAEKVRRTLEQDFNDSQSVTAQELKEWDSGFDSRCVAPG